MGGFADIVEAGEKVLVEHFFPEGTVETFDEGVLVRFAGWVYFIATPLTFSQVVNASPRNSDPLSERTTCGRP
ncbi:hypothetical protein GEV915_11270 [Xanthomonas perforans]|nr:hypothetical protein GEV915_11270 [Xanthomonas perforans]